MESHRESYNALHAGGLRWVSRGGSMHKEKDFSTAVAILLKEGILRKVLCGKGKAEEREWFGYNS